MSITGGRWEPSIGDPTLIGWITVAVYFITAIICLKAALQSSFDKENTVRNLWLFLTVFLIALGINKQLDLQTLLTQIGRDIAKEQGWYKDRRIIQISFIILIGLIGTVGITFLFKTYKNAESAIKITLSGCVILLAFILTRASSFHHMDIFIYMKFIGVGVNGLLELGSLIIIGLGGFRYLYCANA